ncbi:penicillin acylase family protein [Streptomonospora sediminis]
MRNRRTIAGALLACGIATAPFLAAPGQGMPLAAANSEEYTLPGLDDKVDIVVDSAGVPHIYAENTGDAFFAQGMNAARDRLFQIDLQRRRGLGRLSAVLGPDFAEQDRAARLFLYRGSMRKEWASYGPGARAAARNFTEGINAYIGWLQDNPDRMPPEFTELGYEPARWKPEDVVRIRSNSLAVNIRSEVARARIACAAGLGADALRARLEPAHDVQVPDGLEPCSVPADVLDAYALATAPVALDGGGEPQPASAGVNRAASEGSNSWVVSPDRTSTGRPMLAGDPHRAMSAPSLRYIAHLSAPGMDVIGAGEPSLPGVSMGHNGTAAFGLTIFPADQQDLYVYELHPDKPDRYRYRGRWEKMRTVTEHISVAGGGKRKAELAFTRHGPVIKTDVENGRAFALRTSWTEPGTAAYFGSMRLLGVEDFAGFRAAMNQWGGPPLNFTYADTSGDIGWSPGALLPDRTGENYDGLLPVPGDGRYEWDGFADGSRLPAEHNPSRGYFSTANEYNMPDGHPLQVGYEWSPPYRQEHITEVLAEDGSVSLADSVSLQSDTVDTAARRVLPLLDGLQGREGLEADGPAGRALDVLRGWDGTSAADSGAAALYHTWTMRHLGQAFYREASPEAAQHIAFPQQMSALVDALHEPERWFGGDAQATLDGILARSLGAAYEDVAGQLGGDPAQWRWGDLQQVAFDHPVHGTLGPFDQGGSWNTVDASLFDPGTYRQLDGASFKMVLDVGNWDASLAVNAPGQSGNPNDPHYADHLAPWRRDDPLPLHYSRSAVMSDADQVVTLRPRR